MCKRIHHQQRIIGSPEAGRRRQQELQNHYLQANDDQENTHLLQDILRESINEHFYLNKKPGRIFANELSNAYDKILFPTGEAGKNFINVMTWLIC